MWRGIVMAFTACVVAIAVIYVGLWLVWLGITR